MTSSVSESFLTNVLSDNHLALCGGDYADETFAEVSNLQTLPEFVWQQLACLCPGSSAGDLRHSVLTGVLASVAYIQYKILDELQSLPWCLLRGGERHGATCEGRGTE
eukprot:5416194-Amphidinium_carterae.1